MPILIGFGLFLSLIFIKDKKWFKLALGVTLLLIVHWFYSYYGFGNKPISSENQHILFWNIDDRQFLPREAIREKITTYDPEIITFSEIKKLGMTEIKYLKEQFPQYEFRILRGYMLVAVKGKIDTVKYTKLKTVSKFNLVKATIAGKKRTLLIADIGVVRRYYNRWQDLEIILQEGLEHKADMIYGDFNTPYESYHFNAFKENYRSFHGVSEGFAATWPIGLPLFELDQIWATPSITPVSLKKFFYKEFSNHDMLIGSFKFTE